MVTELLLWLKSTLVIRALVLYLRLLDSYWSLDCAMLFTCFWEPFSVCVREHFTLCLFTAQPGIYLLMLHKDCSSLTIKIFEDFLSTLQRKFIDQTEEQAVSILFNQDAPCSLSLFTKETLIAKKKFCHISCVL